jgi:uncharacterized Rossmann fold enzyme
VIDNQVSTMEILRKFKRVAVNPGHYIGHFFKSWKNRYSAIQNEKKRSARLNKLKSLRNIHAGEKCVIIGMGPSLQVIDLDCFKGITTIACNKIYLAFDETDWRPDYYMVSDVLVAENNKEGIDGIEAQKFFPEWVEKRCSGIENINWVPLIEDNNFVSGLAVGFSKDLSQGIEPGGGTVIYDMLQLAYHLGFSDVALVGIDFSFETNQTSGENCEQGEVLVAGEEVNHFVKNYRTPGETWTIPKMDIQKIAFAKAFETFNADGRSLVNASRRTKLKEVTRVDFDDYFSESAT